MSYIEQMTTSYAGTALWSTHNELHDTSLCNRCKERVKLIRSRTGADKWGSPYTEEVTPCTDGGAHDVPHPEEHSEMLDGDYDVDDIHADTMAAMRADCESFYRSAGEDLDDIEAGQAGYDFWLTREGHGAGFWDRGLGDRGDRLTKLSKPYGDFNLWVDLSGPSPTVRHN